VAAYWITRFRGDDSLADVDGLVRQDFLVFFGFFLAVFLAVFFFALFVTVFFVAFFGTFLPSARASDKPMAIACFLLVTFLPEPPLFSVPALRFFIARSTVAAAFFEYSRAMNAFSSLMKQIIRRPDDRSTVIAVRLCGSYIRTGLSLSFSNA
jgi:hypothetical protein